MFSTLRWYLSHSPDLRTALRPTVRSVLTVVLLGLTATTLAWRFGVSSVTEQAESAFQGRAGVLMTEIERSTTAHEHVLRGTQALFETLSNVGRKQFRKYVEALQIAENFPGIMGIGFVASFSAAEKDARIAAIRSDGYPSYTIWPEGNRELYSAVVHIEPFEQNREMIGFDMRSDPVRRAAMGRACDSGLPAASGYVTRPGSTGEGEGIFLLYLPLYRTNAPVETVEERRKALHGFVFTPLRASELMKGVFARQFPQTDQFMRVTIFDMTGGSTPKRFYQSETVAGTSPQRPRKPRFSVEASRDLYGATWLLRFESTPAFEQSIDYSGAHTLLAAGVMATALLSILVLSIGQRQVMADEANERMSLMTRELAHRVKNTLAVVQSIATRSLSDGRNVREAREVFSKRLHALARAHTLLLNSSWSGAPLRELVRAELEPFGARAVVSGPDVQLSAGTAQTLALILHELATNAVKYGAMSNATGRVTVRWTVVGRGRNAIFRFEWKESGGPPVQEPTRRGFGQTLLRQSLSHGPDSAPKISFDPGGLRYEFSAPLAAISADTSDELTLPDEADENADDKIAS